MKLQIRVGGGTTIDLICTFRERRIKDLLDFLLEQVLFTNEEKQNGANLGKRKSYQVWYWTWGVLSSVEEIGQNRSIFKLLKSNIIIPRYELYLSIATQLSLKKQMVSKVRSSGSV